jgi:hypothetical protein
MLRKSRWSLPPEQGIEAENKKQTTRATTQWDELPEGPQQMVVSLARNPLAALASRAMLRLVLQSSVTLALHTKPSSAAEQFWRSLLAEAIDLKLKTSCDLSGLLQGGPHSGVKSLVSAWQHATQSTQCSIPCMFYMFYAMYVLCHVMFYMLCTIYVLYALCHCCVHVQDVLGTPAGLPGLASTLQAVPGLEHLFLDIALDAKSAQTLAPTLQQFTGLKQLGLLMDAEGAEALAPTLQHLTGLQQLRLGYMQLGEACAAALAPTLLALTGLQQLDLSGVLDHKGIEALALGALTWLRGLDLGSNTLGAKAGWDGWMDDWDGTPQAMHTLAPRCGHSRGCGS